MPKKITFNHDCNLRNNPHIIEMRMYFGWDGYGIYCAVIETLRIVPGCKYPITKVVGLASFLGVEHNKLHRIIFEFKLFVTDEEFFWSEWLLSDADKTNRTAQSARDRVSKRWNRIEAPTETQEQEKPKVIVTEPVKPPKVKKPKKEKAPPSDEGLRIARFFKETLIAGTKVTDTQIINWAYTYDELIRIDKRPPEEIIRVLKFARRDDFWKKQILSITGLRQANRKGVMYYDVLLALLPKTNESKQYEVVEKLVTDSNEQDEFIKQFKSNK